MTPVPQVYLDHLAAITGPEPATVRESWDPQGVLEFPYAPSDSPARRLAGADAIVAYFDGPKRFDDWRFTDIRAAKLEDADEYVLEMHGSSVIRETGRAYEQDYVVRFALTPGGKLRWMREFWDPTRL